MEGIHLYRRALRAVHRFPIKAVGSRVQENIRCLSELYKDCSDQEIKVFRQNATHDVSVLEALADLPPLDFKKLMGN